MAWLHKILQVNSDKTGICASCGSVSIYTSTSNGRTYNSCYKSIKERNKKYTPKKRVRPNRYKSVSTATKNVYLIKAENGLIKIGVAINVNTRLATLACASPCKLEKVFSIQKEFAYIVENSLHTRFKKERSHGEWFSLSEEQIEDCINLLSEE